MKIGAAVRLGPQVEGKRPPAPFSAIRDMARRMEAAGLDSIWVYDHLLYRWPGRPTDGIWEAWTMLAALAVATHRVELGTLVACTQFRHPALLAKMSATLDEVSGARLTLGIGAGWHRPEFDAFGFPFDHRVDRFEEAVNIIATLLRQGEFDFDGKYYQLRHCELIPRGPRPNGPPLMIAGAGPRMLQLAARFADCWNTAWHASADSAAVEVERVREACRREGRDPSTLGLTVCVPVAYPELDSGVGRSGVLTGSVEEVAQALHEFVALGVEQVMVEFAPYTPAALDRFAAAVQKLRAT